jgi:hypothetical protein
MAASSNESFGLKIATAFSIALTVVLLVAVYFLNSNYNLEMEKNNKQAADITKLNTSLRDVTTQANEYRGIIGFPNIEEFDAAKAAIKKDQDQLKVEIADIEKEIENTTNEYQKKMETKGADASQFEALRQNAKQFANAYVSNSDPSYKAALTRLKDLAFNQAKLTNNIALNYIELRRDLELANKVNADEKKVVQDAFDNAKAELDATIKKDEEARAGLVADNRTKADQLAGLETKLTNLSNELTAKLEKRDKTVLELKGVLADLRDIMNKKEDVMSKPGGRVTYVDYNTKTLRVSVNRAQGVRPLMRFTIFDKNAAGITSDRPKASVELIKVGDPQLGENDSLARIVKTFDPADPIRYNDFIYSVGWSYDHPQRFGLIGKLDTNRDGKDDRAEIIRMIEAAGGVVEFDLPPPGVDRGPGQAAVARAFTRMGEPIPPSVGRASGKLSGLAFAYVTDDRAPLVSNAKKPADVTKDDTAFLQEQSLATREARENNVRPLPLEKLLNLLGFDFAAPIEGRREAFSKPGIKALLKPKAVPTGAAPSTAPPETPPAEGAAPMPADTPK